MQRIRPFVRWLIVPLAALASFASAGPQVITTASVAAATLNHLDLSKTTAAVTAALEPLAGGTPAPFARVNAASSATAVAGAGGLARAITSLGDVDGDKAADLLDLRASNGTLNYSVISGAKGIPIWRAAPVVRPTTVYAAAYPAVIASNDFYLVEQYQANGNLNWSLHAVSGATGADLWVSTGSMPAGEQPQPKIPPDPPTPPTGVPTALPSEIPTGLPTPSCLPTDAPGLPEVPAVPSIPPSVPPAVPSIPPELPIGLPTPTCLPTGIPSALPSEVPTGLPSALPIPSGLPSGLPTLPTLPIPLPSEIPTGVPSALPSGVPSGLPSGVPTDVGVPSDVPSALPSDVPTLPPLPVPTITPPASANGRRSAPRAAQTTFPTPFVAYAAGAKPVDVNGNGKADFPLTVYFGISDAALGTLVEASLMMISDAGLPITTVIAVGRGAVPYAGVSGDFTGQGRPGIFVADEINDPALGAIVTMRGFTGTGSPLFAGVQTFPAGTIGAYDATSDLTGDGMADVLVSRFSIAPAAAATVISVRSAPLGLEAWKKTYNEIAIGFVTKSIDTTAGSDVLVQGIQDVVEGKIPSAITYRAISGNGTDLYSTAMAIPSARTDGNWSASLVPNAGDLNSDGFTDLSHSVLVIPTDKPLSWTQSGVNAKTGTSLWSHSGVDAASVPVHGTLNSDAATDFVNVLESATKTADALVIRAASGADGSQIWSTRVGVGGGTERVRSIALLAADLSTTGAGVNDLIVTVFQRSGTNTRTILAAVRGVGAGGKVLWIRTN